MKNTHKVGELKKNPHTSISIWSGREFTDSWGEIKAKGEVHEDLATKKRYYEPDV